MTHAQANVLDWELGIIAGVTLFHFIVGLLRRG